MTAIDSSDHFAPRPSKGPSAMPAHGGYRRLVSWRVAVLAQDLTERFIEHFVPKDSRTRDQMRQAARSGVANIAEGSQVSGTSRTTEHRLTGVARASLEELRCDYWDYLRQHGHSTWTSAHPRRVELVGKRFASLDALLDWIRSTASEDQQPVDATAANAALTLLTVACSLLERQLESQARALKERTEERRYQRYRP